MENLRVHAVREGMAPKAAQVVPRRHETAVRERRDDGRVLIAGEVGRVGIDREFGAGLAAVGVEDLAANTVAGLIDAFHAGVRPDDNKTPADEGRYSPGRLI